MSASKDSPETGELSGIARETIGLVGDTLKLAGLETRLAGVSLAIMLALGFASALFGVTSWILLNAALADWLATHAWSWPSALLAIAGLNAITALAATIAAWRRSRHLQYPATRRQLYRLTTLHKPVQS